MVKVGVTNFEYNKARHVFAAAVQGGIECIPMPVDELELAQAVRAQGIRHVIIGVEAYRGPLYDALDAGGVIARFGIGHDGVDKKLASERGILCINTPGVLDDSVAEHAVSLMMAAVRDTVGLDTSTRAGRWCPKVGGTLKGKALAVIGCGPIGRQVARIAAFGFGMNVYGCEVQDVDVPAMKRRFGFLEVVKSFDAAVKNADFVSLHIPSTDVTFHYMDRERLSGLSASCWLVNTARGALVDESALYDVLKAGDVGGAALDVFEHEPYVPVAPGKDLRVLEHVIMTPHVAGSTQQACDRMAERTLRNIRLAEAGTHVEMDLLNKDALLRCDGY